MERRAAPRRAVAALAPLAALGALAGVWCARAGAAHVLHCGSVTIPASVTKTIPLTYARTTVAGVSCRYAEKVFLVDISKAGAAPPAGWTIRVDATVTGEIRDTCTRGRQAITFLLLKKT